MIDFKFGKSFGKVSASKASAANKAIEKIAISDKSTEQKAKAIAVEFDKAYKGTGLDSFGTAQIDAFKKMLRNGQVPTVSDKPPLR